MRRAAVLGVRTILVLLLLAAIADLPLPAASRPRRRVHLIDRSASVSLGPASAPKPRDADAVVAFDRAQGRGEVLFASFAGDVRFDSTVVEDPGRSDLRGALEAVLGRDPTEIVLHSDGRADPGPATALCKARGVPVHVLPLGPADVRDIRFTRVRAPAEASPGERFSIEVTLEATWPLRARVRLGDELRELELAPGAPAALVFPGRTAGEHPLSVESDDDVPQNNRLSVRVLERTSKRRVLAPPGAALPPDFERAADLADAHAALVSGPLPPERRRELARWVREGGGVLFVGREGIEGELEDVAPVRARPDHEVAVVLAVDVSGSMLKDDRVGSIVRAAEDVAATFGEGDRLFYMAFSNNAAFMPPSELKRQRASGATLIVHALEEAKKRLDQEEGRKHVLLFTDGLSEETPEARAAAWKALTDAGIGLTVVTIDKELDIARPNVRLGDVERLVAVLGGIFDRIRETRRERPGRLDVDPEHPVLKGLGPIEPAALDLTALKPGALRVASLAPAYPAIAFARAGHGMSGALLFAPDAALLSRALAQVAKPASGAFRLSVEPPFVRARGPEGPPRLKARAGGADFELARTRSDLWEGRLPELRAGTLLVELEAGGRAAATLPCAPEYERAGADREALKRIADETGGRMLGSSADLSELPPPAAKGERPGRPFFLWAALAALFVELGLSTFWKPR